MKFTFLFFWLLLLSYCSNAQDTLQPATHEIDVEDLLQQKALTDEFEDVSIITTSRTGEQKSSKAPGTVFVVTEEQIRKRGYTSLSELLMDVPNVRVDNLVDPRWNNNIIIRGITGTNANANDKFILLIDGVRANSPTNDIIPSYGKLSYSLCQTSRDCVRSCVSSLRSRCFCGSNQYHHQIGRGLQKKRSKRNDWLIQLLSWKFCNG